MANMNFPALFNEHSMSSFLMPVCISARVGIELILKVCFHCCVAEGVDNCGAVYEGQAHTVSPPKRHYLYKHEYSSSRKNPDVGEYICHQHLTESGA